MENKYTIKTSFTPKWFVHYFSLASVVARSVCIRRTCIWIITFIFVVSFLQYPSVLLFINHLAPFRTVVMSCVSLTNRFYVAVCLFSSRSQMTSKCGKNKDVAHEPQASVSVMFACHVEQNKEKNFPVTASTYLYSYGSWTTTNQSARSVHIIV